MKNKDEIKQSICIAFNCSECCRPVKINSLRIISKNLPFADNNEIFVPKEHPDTVRLKTYICDKFNQSTGKCDDYENRPDICRNTKCKAFETSDREEQARIIKEIKIAEFYHISTG